MKAITREELKDTLRHYWRMRQWAKKQDGKNFAYFRTMYNEIGEAWLGVDCFLCRKYGIGKIVDQCENCPVHENGENCIKVENSLWSQINYSENWDQWIEHVNVFCDWLIKLPRE